MINIKDSIFKIKCLFAAMSYTFTKWKEDVWNCEYLDDTNCCYPSDYNPCSCAGATNREVIRWQYLGE